MMRRNDTRALAVALLAAGATSGGVAAAAIAAGPTAHAAATTPAAGRFSGRTSQSKSISFRVSGGRVRNMSLKIRWRCGRTSKTYPVTANVPLRIRSGKFGAGSTGSPVRIRGTFTSRRSAAGTIRVHYRLSRTTYCDSGTVRWTARS
jgi:hypothetical protein